MKSDFELANIVCQAWNELNVELLEADISDNFLTDETIPFVKYMEQ